jgi:magnesium chelatase family protein
MSLAHRGLLFMDEAPEFDARVLEGLRQPLESGQISIGRSERTATFPAQFQLILAANPCPCGYDWGRDDRCECSPAGKRRYRGKISGPIRDRVDIYRQVRPVQRHDLRSDLACVETTETVAARVHAARSRQGARFAGTPWRRNAEVPGTFLRTHWPVRAGKIQDLERELAAGRISARGVDRVLRLSWTLADLAERAEPDDDDVVTAMKLRTSDLLSVARTRAGEGAA